MMEDSNGPRSAGKTDYFPGDPRLHEELVRAMRRLSRIPRTEAETREKLVSREVPSQAVEEIVAILKREGFLNDARYAAGYTRFQLERGYGPARIRRELIGKGVAGRIAEAALAELGEDFDEKDILRAALAKRLRTNGEPRTPRELKNLGDFLTRRGFSPVLIREELEPHFDRVLSGGG
jgi:regulatory protein